MLLIHETHRVAGAHETAFEAAFRDAWMPELGRTDDARLLYYLHLAHGTGRAYTVVTITAVRDGNAWHRLVNRIARGDLRAWTRTIDRMRHDVAAKVLAPVDWSPLRSVDLPGVSADVTEHPLTLFMEDTAWPHEAMLEDYLAAARDHYAPSLAEGRHGGRAMLELQGVFAPVWGAAPRRTEVILWQKVRDPARVATLVSTEIPPEHRGPGTWMHDALAVRDDWESRLLRTTAWSPWF